MLKSTRNHIKAPLFKNGLALKSLLACGASCSYLTALYNATTRVQVTTGAQRHHNLSKIPDTGSLCLISCGPRYLQLYAILPHLS